MPTISVPTERFLFGNEHWRSYRAIDEIEVYCDLLESLDDRIGSLETRGKDEEVTLINVQAVISSYAFEIAIKSLWALDNSPKCVPHIHDLSTFLDGLRDETVQSLKQLQLTKDLLRNHRQPFVSNRFSMEKRSRDITVYPAGFLRFLIELLADKLEETRKRLLTHHEAGRAARRASPMKYTVIIEKGPTSYGAYLPDLPGCVAAGESREEAISLITEAVKDHVELMVEHGETVPEPTISTIKVEVPVPDVPSEAGVRTAPTTS